jgi:hypothetical protein
LDIATIIDCTKDASAVRMRTVRHLHDLIAALDRRVPQVERVGEASIAQAAAALRREAVKRIEELEGEESTQTPARDEVSRDGPAAS